MSELQRPDEIALARFASGEWICDTKTGTIYRRMTAHVCRDPHCTLSTNTSPFPGSVFPRCTNYAVAVDKRRIPPEGMQIDHINGDSTDNRICNLRL